MFRFFFIIVPVALLIPTPNLSISSFVIIWGTWTLYVHTDSPDLCLSHSARYVFVDNLFHHYHHGRDEHYYDKNFGFFFSIWDHLFGTSHMPVGQKFPETGLVDVPPPTGFVEYISHPFILSGKKLKKDDD